MKRKAKRIMENNNFSKQLGDIKNRFNILKEKKEEFNKSIEEIVFNATSSKAATEEFSNIVTDLLESADIDVMSIDSNNENIVLRTGIKYNCDTFSAKKTKDNSKELTYRSPKRNILARLTAKDHSIEIIKKSLKDYDTKVEEKSIYRKIDGEYTMVLYMESLRKKCFDYEVLSLIKYMYDKDSQILIKEVTSIGKIGDDIVSRTNYTENIPWDEQDVRGNRFVVSKTQKNTDKILKLRSLEERNLGLLNK